MSRAVLRDRPINKTSTCSTNDRSAHQTNARRLEVRAGRTHGRSAGREAVEPLRIPAFRREDLPRPCDRRGEARVPAPGAVRRGRKPAQRVEEKAAGSQLIRRLQLQLDRRDGGCPLVPVERGRSLRLIAWRPGWLSWC